MIYIGPDWFIIAIMTVAKTENSIILKIGNIVIQQFSYLPSFTKDYSMKILEIRYFVLIKNWKSIDIALLCKSFLVAFFDRSSVRIFCLFSYFQTKSWMICSISSLLVSSVSMDLKSLCNFVSEFNWYVKEWFL